MNRVDRKTGRPFCRVSDPATGRCIELSPVAFDVLYRVVVTSATCAVELNFIAGSVGNSHVKFDGEKWSRTNGGTRHAVASEILQSVAT